MVAAVPALVVVALAFITLALVALALAALALHLCAVEWRWVSERLRPVPLLPEPTEPMAPISADTPPTRLATRIWMR